MRRNARGRHEVSSAVPVGRTLRVALERLIVEIQRVPHAHAGANIERKRQLVRFTAWLGTGALLRYARMAAASS